MAKHVIILGAGASDTSGYPLNKKLGTILSSHEGFEQYARDQDTAPQLKQKLIKDFKEKLEEWLLPFRNGRFDTVDEFSSQFRDSLKPVVQNLKWYTAWAFVLHNPQESSGSCETGNTTGPETSDYLTFVKKLFKEGTSCLREDIAVLTYNYDAYFEFLLSSAFKGRLGDNHAQIPTAFVSGLGDLDAHALLKAKGFCFLKLHGTSVLPVFVPPPGRRNRAFTFDNFFVDRAQLGKLPDPIRVGRPETPPIFFPWELITKRGGFVTKQGFKFTVGSRQYYDIFKAIWQRGQREVTEAERISFVGFSAHPFMEHGLRFLFKARARQIKAGTKLPLKLVTANPDSVPEGHHGNTPPPGGHVDRLQKLLEAACPGLPGLGEIVCYPDFESFLNKGPLQ
jgi:hypothetical protein